ncbi:MAG: right-handed parallel beta-helix repeat-containing protein [Candidatus Thermoplasmatota archaeon]|nr:right-handed parallel beta-helix repeat-containing protein [Candidatus Thermoplasmatota archaeon]
MNRKQGNHILLFLTILLFLLQSLPYNAHSAPPVYQDTLIVDITGNGDYTRIRDAIAAAASTDIILIKEGIYVENSLEINKKISIIGDDPSNTIIDCNNNNGFLLRSSYIDISNLKLINLDEYAIDIHAESDWCTISNCIIEVTQARTAIWIRASSVTIDTCDIQGAGQKGIGITLQETNSIIQDCNIHEFSVGILALTNAHDHSIINCNIFNNEVGIDIRINSNYNLISKCNIYSNNKGINIWLNSNNNSAYLNNFWKNDNDATDTDNNIWDNGNQGNYWDDYRGQDTNGDGIGDTPYTISTKNADKYPLITMTLPDEITLPTSIKRITSTSNTTPFFTWNPSVYNQGIKGYYVKIDNNPETYISDITSWTSPESLLDGVHTFYIRAEGKDASTSAYATHTFSIDTTFIDTDEDGWSDDEEQQYGTNPNNPDHYPLDSDNDRIPDSIDDDDDNDGYNDNIETSYGTSRVNPDDHPTDTDNDHLPDDNSPDGKYIGDVDDDDDSLIDTIEIQLGSNPKTISDVQKIYLQGDPHYLIDISQNSIYDILYEPISDTTTAVEKTNENYLIDQDGDGSWYYLYNIGEGSITSYEKPLTLPILILILLTIISVIIIIYYFIRSYNKKPDIPQKYITPVSMKKPPVKISTGDKRTIENIDDTKTLLHQIQQNVTIFMDELQMIEDQVTTIPVDKEQIDKDEKTLPPPKETSQYENIHEVEQEIDKVLLESKNKNKTLQENN